VTCTEVRPLPNFASHTNIVCVASTSSSAVNGFHAAPADERMSPHWIVRMPGTARGAASPSGNRYRFSRATSEPGISIKADARFCAGLTSLQSRDGNAGVRRIALEARVLWHDAERADLAAVADLGIDVDERGEPHHRAAAQPYASGSHDPVLDRVAGNVHVRSDDDVVADFEQIVIADVDRVDVD